MENLIYGTHAVLEALREGKGIDKIILERESLKDGKAELIALAKEAGVYIQQIPRDSFGASLRKFHVRRDANHQGVMAFLSLIQYYEIEDVLDHVYANGGTPLFLVLEGVTDVGNFGAIARSAVCLGAQAIIIPAKGSAQINADAMKTSAGALNKIHVVRTKEFGQALNFLKKNGIRIYATQMNAELSITEADLAVPCAIILGSEDTGITRAMEIKSDALVSIPMSGDMDSLNVSVSAGIALYEAQRQRAAKS